MAYETTDAYETLRQQAGNSAQAEPSVDAAGPFSRVGLETEPICKCGSIRRGQTDRCVRGHVWRGTPGPALVAGANSLIHRTAEQDARAAIAAAVVADAGHDAATAPEALRLAAESIAQASLIQQSAYTRLVDAGGPLAASGRIRRAFAVWQVATDRLDRGLRLVGLHRKSKHVPMSLAEALQRAPILGGDDADR